MSIDPMLISPRRCGGAGLGGFCRVAPRRGGAPWNRQPTESLWLDHTEMSLHEAPSTETGQLERALAFMRACMATTADESRPIQAGFVVSTPSLPAV